MNSLIANLLIHSLCLFATDRTDSGFFHRVMNPPFRWSLSQPVSNTNLRWPFSSAQQMWLIVCQPCCHTQALVSIYCHFQSMPTRFADSENDSRNLTLTTRALWASMSSCLYLNCSRILSCSESLTSSTETATEKLILKVTWRSFHPHILFCIPVLGATNLSTFCVDRVHRGSVTV